MSSVEQKVKHALAEQLDISIDNIVLDNHIVNDLGADSLDLVEATMALEDEFNCLINAEDFDRFKTVSDVVDWLRQHGKGDQ
jgi:acyl carrier protein